MLLEWVLLKMEEFGSFLGLSYDGFEAKIVKLFKAIKGRKMHNENEYGTKSARGKQLLKELKKVESNINNDRKEGRMNECGDRRGKGIVFK